MVLPSQGNPDYSDFELPGGLFERQMRKTNECRDAGEAGQDGSQNWLKKGGIKVHRQVISRCPGLRHLRTAR